jgi:hypothetical protein
MPCVKGINTEDACQLHSALDEYLKHRLPNLKNPAVHGKNTYPAADRTMTTPSSPARIVRIFVSAMTLVMLCSSANGCSCLARTLKAQYYDPSATRVVRAVVQREWPAVITDQAQKKYYLISVKQVFKGCAKPSLIWISTASNSAMCGVSLNVGSEYLLFLTGSGPGLSIFLCYNNTHFNNLSPSDIAFFNSRNVCCGNVCNCASGKPPVRCIRQPCSPPEKAPCPAAVKCQDNYCGGCMAEWFDKAGLPACAAPNPVA